MICNGTPDFHCCWLHGRECIYLDKDPDPFLGRSIACSLLVELGSWDNVYQDQRYIDNVKPELDRMINVSNCGTWPPEGQECRCKYL